MAKMTGTGIKTNRFSKGGNAGLLTLREICRASHADGISRGPMPGWKTPTREEELISDEQIRDTASCKKMAWLG